MPKRQRTATAFGPTVRPKGITKRFRRPRPYAKKAWRKTFKRAVKQIIEQQKDCKEVLKEGMTANYGHHAYAAIHGTNLYAIDCIEAADGTVPEEIDSKCIDKDFSIHSVVFKGEMTKITQGVPCKIEIFRARMTRYAQNNGHTPTTVNPAMLHGFFDPKLLKVKKIKTVYLGAAASGSAFSMDERPLSRDVSFGISFKKPQRVRIAGNQPVSSDFDNLPYILMRFTRLDGDGTLSVANDVRFLYKYKLKYCDNEARTGEIGYTNLA